MISIRKHRHWQALGGDLEPTTWNWKTEILVLGTIDMIFTLKKEGKGKMRKKNINFWF